MKMTNKKYTLPFVLTLVLSASALTCLVLSLLFFFTFRPGHSERNETGTFAELLDVIDRRFIGSFDTDEIVLTAMRAAVDSLDDDWSYFMSPDEYITFLENSNNRYTGIGVEVRIDEETEGIMVMGVYRDSGADLAGLTIGDVITGVDGESIQGLTLPEIRQKLRRPLGETANLTVLRADGEYHTVTVQYDIVFTNPVTYEMLENNIGYVSLRNFEESAGERFVTAVRALIDEGAVAFIYDVRSNNGGRVSEVTHILDFLLPEGEIFISVDRSGVENITRSGPSFIDIPAVVLVNSFSYSGAEYFAAMLHEYDYAPSVGEQTTGKNRMQTTIPLTNGSAVHLSTGHYLTKNRISLFDNGGFTPDYEIALTEDEQLLFRRGELDHKDDPQLQKALQLLS